MKTVQTTDYSYVISGIPRRISAYIFDVCICFGVLFMIQGIIYGLGLNPLVQSETIDPFHFWAWVFFTVTIPVWLYFSLYESSEKQATIGKQWLRMKVFDQPENRPGRIQALIRNALKLVPFELNHVILILGGYETGFLPWGPIPWLLIALYLLVMFPGTKRRSIHDLLTGTLVMVDRTYTRSYLKERHESAQPE